MNAEFFTIAGIIALIAYTIWDKLDGKSKMRRIEADGVSDKLVKNLNYSVGELERKVSGLQAQQKESIKLIGELQDDNKKMRDILANRDPHTSDFYARAEKAMQEFAELKSIFKELVQLNTSIFNLSQENSAVLADLKNNK